MWDLVSFSYAFAFLFVEDTDFGGFEVLKTRLTLARLLAVTRCSAWNISQTLVTPIPEISNVSSIPI